MEFELDPWDEIVCSLIGSQAFKKDEIWYLRGTFYKDTSSYHAFALFECAAVNVKTSRVKSSSVKSSRLKASRVKAFRLKAFRLKAFNVKAFKHQKNFMSKCSNSSSMVKGENYLIAILFQKFLVRQQKFLEIKDILFQKKVFLFSL